MISTIDNAAVRRLSAICALAVVTVAVLVLTGYAADVDRLRNGLVGDLAIRPNAAIALLCLGVALLLRPVPRRVAGAVALAVGVLTLLQWATGAPLGIDTLLFGGAERTMRMSIPVALACALGGAALLFTRPRWVGQALGAAAGFIGALSVVASLYGARLLPGEGVMPAALSAGILLVVWAVAYLLAMSGGGPLAVLQGTDEWASFARRTAAVTLSAPVMLGALSLAVAGTGFYDQRFAAALIVTATVFTLFPVTLYLIANIRRTETVYRTIVESAHDGIGLTGPDMRIRIVNQRLASMLGYRAEELVGRAVHEVIAGDDMPQLVERAAQRSRDGAPTQTEVRLRRRDGSELPVISAASHVTTPDGSDGGTVIILTDISERIGAEDALRVSETRFRRLYDSNVIGVAFWGDDGVVYEANEEVLRIFGVSREEIPGWRWSEHNTPEGELADRQAIDDLRANGRSASFEKKCIRRDGRHIWVQVVAAELDEERNIAFISDVTEREEARRSLERAYEILAERVTSMEGAGAADQDQDPESAQVEVLAARLAAANEELETFSYSVSHDLRAPLRAIDGFSRELMLTLGRRLDEESSRYLSRIRSATQRMARLIDDLLDLSRLSRQPMNRTVVDVSALAADVAAELGTQHVEIQPNLTATADRHLLRVVLHNLIGNAVKFSSHRAEPRVEVFAAGDGAIAVRDNGVGFDMQYASKIFAPFQRLHPVSQFEGTGIGLALVHRIVARHGGTIRADAAPDRGATFSLTFGDPAS